MGFDIGALSQSRPPKPAASRPVTDMSAEATGGQSVRVGPVAVGDADEQFILYGAVTVIAVSIVILWSLGAFAFRGLPTI